MIDFVTILIIHCIEHNFRRMFSCGRRERLVQWHYPTVVSLMLLNTIASVNPQRIRKMPCFFAVFRLGCETSVILQIFPLITQKYETSIIIVVVSSVLIFKNSSTWVCNYSFQKKSTFPVSISNKYIILQTKLPFLFEYFKQKAAVVLSHHFFTRSMIIILRLLSIYQIIYLLYDNPSLQWRPSQRQQRKFTFS